MVALGVFLVHNMNERVLICTILTNILSR
jgi:hypothetical protein